MEIQQSEPDPTRSYILQHRSLYLALIISLIFLTEHSLLQTPEKAKGKKEMEK